MQYSILIPVYNSEKTLTGLVNRICDVFRTLDGAYEIILVDDGSRLETWDQLKRLASKNPELKIIRLSRNFGQQRAVLCGLRFCRGEYIVTMDDDLQDPPEEIPKLIEALKSDPEADAVCGKPVSSRESFLRRLSGNAYHTLQNFIYRSDLRLRVTSFKILRRWVADELLKNQSKNPLIADLLLEVTEHIKNIDVKRDARAVGRSGYNLPMLIRQSWDMVVNRSDLPLQLISVIGFTSSFVAVGMIIYYLVRYFVGGIGVSGWMTLVILNLFFPGMILFSFGVVGQYLRRIIREVNSTPQSVIREMEGVE